MPSATSSTSESRPRPLDSLPNELLREIFTRIDDEARTKETQDTLLSLCLTSKLFNNLSQPLLLRRICTSLGTGTSQIEQIVGSKSEEELSRVRTFYYDTPRSKVAHRSLNSFASQARNVREIYVDTDVTVFSAFLRSNLTTLSLHKVVCDLRGHSFAFPELVNLSLTNCTFDKKKPIPSDLPKLQHLAFFAYALLLTRPEMNFILRYTPTLTSLTTGLHTILPRSILDSTSLSILAWTNFLGYHGTTIQNVKHLCITVPNEQQKLPRYHYRSAANRFDQYTEAILTSTTPLETVTWSVNAGAEGIPNQNEELRDAMSALNKACYKRGVKVFWVEENEARTFDNRVPRWFVEKAEARGRKMLGGRSSK
ncbi:hypothetical protein JCM3765_003479 [Sporobolomyces pararoseus]